MQLIQRFHTHFIDNSYHIVPKAHAQFTTGSDAYPPKVQYPDATCRKITYIKFRFCLEIRCQITWFPAEVVLQESRKRGLDQALISPQFRVREGD